MIYFSAHVHVQFAGRRANGQTAIADTVIIRNINCWRGLACGIQRIRFRHAASHYVSRHKTYTVRPNTWCTSCMRDRNIRRRAPIAEPRHRIIKEKKSGRLDSAGHFRPANRTLLRHCAYFINHKKRRNAAFYFYQFSGAPQCCCIVRSASIGLIRTWGVSITTSTSRWADVSREPDSAIKSGSPNP